MYYVYITVYIKSGPVVAMVWEMLNDKLLLIEDSGGKQPHQCVLPVFVGRPIESNSLDDKLSQINCPAPWGGGGINSKGQGRLSERLCCGDQVH